MTASNALLCICVGAATSVATIHAPTVWHRVKPRAAVHRVVTPAPAPAPRSECVAPALPVSPWPALETPPAAFEGLAPVVPQIALPTRPVAAWRHQWLDEGPSWRRRATVPEPGAWVMMVAGFGFVGAMMRRKESSQ